MSHYTDLHANRIPNNIRVAITLTNGTRVAGRVTNLGPSHIWVLRYDTQVVKIARSDIQRAQSFDARRPQ